MKISKYLTVSVGLLIAFTFMTPTLSFAKDSPPNIVYIMADELGYYELSCMGHPYLKTPRIDKLASEGVRFTQGLAGSSVCAPTRCVLMTGKHSGRTSVRSNGGGTPLREGEETIASVLKKKGYATGGFGKWGCGGRGSTGVPEKHGFDTFIGYYDQVHAHTYYPPYLIKNSEELVLEGNKGGRTGKTYSQYVIYEEAKKFIRKNKDQPFFAYLPFTPPHGMFDVPKEDPAFQLYKDKDWHPEAINYAALVTLLDRQVGGILDLLEELKLTENTVVFFCGDNGGNDYFKSKEHPRGFHGPNVHPKTGVEFRGHKGRLYEGGLRIPMMVRWPGKIKAGRLSDHLWYFPDVLPTVAEFAKAKVPSDITGISIVPELLGEEVVGRKQAQHKYLYWELGSQTAVRMKNWKAVRPKQNSPWELYDLSKDISETRDVSKEQAQILKQMLAFAEEAHEPVREGIFHSTELHEKDRRAKGMGSRPRKGKVFRLTKRGLLARDQIKIVKVSSESKVNNKLARHAIDGNPRTHWHTRFAGEPEKHPHELILDLGQSRKIKGFRYLARQDNGWNGAIKDCEFYISDSKDAFEGQPVKATFKKDRKSQEVQFEVRNGRYVKLKILSEVNGGPWASISELGVIAK